MSIKVMTHVWDNAKQKGSAMLLLLAIADMANDEGECWPSTETLAHKARVSVRTAQWTIYELEAAGELAVQERPGTSNLYIVPVPWRKDPAVSVRLVTPKRRAKGQGRLGVNTGTPPDETPETAEITPQGVQTGTGVRVNTVAPKPSVEPSLETKEKEPSSAPPTGETAPPPPLDATREALKFGRDSYPLVAKYAQFLTGSVPMRDKRGHDNGDWYTYQIGPPMDAVEIQAFGLWLDDTYDGEPLRKPMTLMDYVGRFRADDSHAYWLDMAHALPDLQAIEAALQAEPEADDSPPVDMALVHNAFADLEAHLVRNRPYARQS